MAAKSRMGMPDAPKVRLGNSFLPDVRKKGGGMIPPTDASRILDHHGLLVGHPRATEGSGVLFAIFLGGLALEDAAIWRLVVRAATRLVRISEGWAGGAFTPLFRSRGMGWKS